MAEGLLTVNKADYLNVSERVINQTLKGSGNSHSHFLLLQCLSMTFW